MIKTGCAGGRRGAVGALPGIQTDVMMIATGGDESSIGSEALHEFKAQDATIKAKGSLEVCDFEVDMTDADLRIDRAGKVEGHFVHSCHEGKLARILRVANGGWDEWEECEEWE